MSLTYTKYGDLNISYKLESTSGSWTNNLFNALTHGFTGDRTKLTDH